MPTKITVHSNSKRFFQVAIFAILIAGTLVGLKKLARERDAPTESMADSIASSASNTASATISGQSEVIDADTLDVSGVRIRLEGIDAPELSQRCGDSSAEWDCGQQAASSLRQWLAARPVTCHMKGLDRYKRQLARCFAGNDDIQSWLVTNGWALAYIAYSDDYISAERVAEARKAGLWRGTFVKPWEWRKQ